MLAFATLGLAPASANQLDIGKLSIQSQAFNQTKAQYDAPEGHNTTANCSSAWAIVGQIGILYPSAMSKTVELGEHSAYSHWRHWIASEMEAAGGRPSQVFSQNAFNEEQRLRALLLSDGEAFFRSVGHCWVHPSVRRLDDIGLFLRSFLIQQQRLPSSFAISDQARQARIRLLREDLGSEFEEKMQSTDSKLIDLCEAYQGVPVTAPRDAQRPKYDPFGNLVPQRELYCELFNE